ncbi:MAG: signal peptidase II, partial [Candidatus Omnitrophota bacterium]
VASAKEIFADLYTATAKQEFDLQVLRLKDVGPLAQELVHKKKLSSSLLNLSPDMGEQVRKRCFVIEARDSFYFPETSIEQRVIPLEESFQGKIHPVVEVQINGELYYVGSNYYLVIKLANGKNIYWGGQHNLSYSFFFDHYREKAQDVIDQGGVIWNCLDAHVDIGTHIATPFIKKENVQWQKEILFGFSRLQCYDFLGFLATTGIAAQINFVHKIEMFDRKPFFLQSIPAYTYSLRSLANEKNTFSLMDLDIDILVMQDSTMHAEKAQENFQIMKPYFLTLAQQSDVCFFINSSELATHPRGVPFYMNPHLAVLFNGKLIAELSQDARKTASKGCLSSPAEMVLTDQDPYYQAIRKEFVDTDKYLPTVEANAKDNNPALYRFIFEKIMQYTGDLRGKAVVEMGARCGAMVRLLRQQGVDAWGLEMESDFVRFATEHGVPLVLANLKSVPEAVGHKPAALTFSRWVLDDLGILKENSTRLGYRSLTYDESLKVLWNISALTPMGAWSIHTTYHRIHFSNEEIARAGFEIVEMNEKRTLMVLKKIKSSESCSSSAVSSPSQRPRLLKTVYDAVDKRFLSIMMIGIGFSQAVALAIMQLWPYPILKGMGACPWVASHKICFDPLACLIPFMRTFDQNAFVVGALGFSLCAIISLVFLLKATNKEVTRQFSVYGPALILSGVAANNLALAINHTVLDYIYCPWLPSMSAHVFSFFEKGEFSLQKIINVADCFIYFGIDLCLIRCAIKGIQSLFSKRLHNASLVQEGIQEQKSSLLSVDSKEKRQEMPYSLRLDPRALEAGLLPEGHIYNDMLIRQESNSYHQNQKGLYYCSGADFSNYLLANNTPRSVFVDRSYRHLEPKDFEGLKDKDGIKHLSYKEAKFSRGWIPADLIEKKRFLVRAMGIELESI